MNTTQTTLTEGQFDNLCWRKLGFKLDNGFEPRVPRRFRDIESGIVCEIDHDVQPWEGRTIDNKPITLISVTAIFLDDVHFLLHSARQIHQLQELH